MNQIKIVSKTAKKHITYIKGELRRYRYTMEGIREGIRYNNKLTDRQKQKRLMSNLKTVQYIQFITEEVIGLIKRQNEKTYIEH